MGRGAVGPFGRAHERGENLPDHPRVVHGGEQAQFALFEERTSRKSDDMPRVHPLVDLCNAVSLAFAVPVATFLDRGYRCCALV